MKRDAPLMLVILLHDERLPPWIALSVEVCKDGVLFLVDNHKFEVAKVEGLVLHPDFHIC